MTCFEGALTDSVFLGTIGIVTLAGLTLFWTLKTQEFNGKSFYTLTFIGMMWTLLTVGLEAASSTFSCKLQWATMAWLGHGLVPVAWCYFIFSYVDNAAWVDKRTARGALIILPVIIFAFAATNQGHHLVYDETSIIPEGGDHIDYVHGPGFYVIIVSLYTFVVATLVCLVKTFARAKRTAWSLLTILAVITLTPLALNAAYVGLGFTFFGLDPTAFMFTLGIVAFSWLLVTNKTMDMASIGQSVLFNTMSEPVILIDRQRNIVQTNTAARSRDLHNGNGHVLADLFANIEQFGIAEDGAHMHIGQRYYEPRIQKVENPLNPSGAVLGWSITFVDITDRIAITASLEEALKKADEANRAKDEFVSVISHEMRTPLTSLKGGLALALSGQFGELSAPMQSLLDIAHRNGVRLSRLIDQILLAQKMDIGALSLENEAVDLGGLLEESLDENKTFASERGVRLAKADIDHSAFVSGDAFAIRQIIDNLISNAIKFASENSVVEGAVQVTGQRAKLSIKDTGPGIPEGMEEKVFGQFQQMGGSSQSSSQGSGLGLYISRQLAKRMLGDIYYESQTGVGTTFYVEFSLVEKYVADANRVAE